MKLKIILLVVLAAIIVLLLTYKTGSNPDKAMAYFEQGKQYLGSNKVDDAIKAYKKGLSNDPTSSEGHNLLGIAYRGKYVSTKNAKFKDLEIKCYKKSIEADPKNWYPYINIGTTYYYAGKKKDAVPYLKKALELNPQNPEAKRIKEMVKEGEGEK